MQSNAGQPATIPGRRGAQQKWHGSRSSIVSRAQATAQRATAATAPLAPSASASRAPFGRYASRIGESAIRTFRGRATAATATAVGESVRATAARIRAATSATTSTASGGQRGVTTTAA